MNGDYPLVPVEGHDHHRPVAGAASAQQMAEVTPLDRVLALMRGRWLWVILLGGVLGGVGSVAGYLVVDPVYESTGMIHVEPVLPRGLDLEDQALPMYTSFVSTQAAVLRDQRNLARALQRTEWDTLREQGREVPSLTQLQRELMVDHPRDSEHVVVRFTHTDPGVAQIAVRTAILAYEEQHEGTQRQDGRLALLEERRNRLRTERRRLRDERRRIGEEFGAADLTPIYRAKLEEAQRLEIRLRETEFALLGLGAQRVDGEGDAAVDPGDVERVADELAGDLTEAAPDEEAIREDLSLRDIASMDGQMRRYLEQRQSLERELRRLTLSLGENHREVRQARTLLESMDETIEEHAEDFQERYARGAGLDFEDGASVEELERRLTLLEQAHAEVRREAVQIGRSNMEMEGLREQEEQVAEDLRRTDQRIAAIDGETRVGGQVQVQSTGDEPLEPVRDRRRLAAVAGLTFGGGAGFALVLAVAFFDRRLRSIEDASDTLGRITMLGILPRLPDDLADPDQASIASHCVHQIRTLLQIGPESSGRRVFSITSPGAGDGKTSLALALGLSFTTAGAKTLMIDFDLGQGGLTGRVDALLRRKIGQVLRREDLVTEQQVEQALRVAQESNRRLGEVLVELGYVTAEDLEEALSVQERTPVGLLDVLHGEPIVQCVADTGIAGLSILPIGSAMPDDVARLSPLTIRRVLEEARQHFDVILVDTGPVPGSLDASHVAAESDGVVMVVSRGEQRTQAERSLDYLASINGRVAGVVFNRAESRDLEAVGEPSDYAALEGRRSGRFAVYPDGSHERFGPVARAVVGTASATAGRNGNGSTNGAAGAHAPETGAD